jgi:hypothetical protein
MPSTSMNRLRTCIAVNSNNQLRVARIPAIELANEGVKRLLAGISVVQQIEEPLQGLALPSIEPVAHTSDDLRQSLAMIDDKRFTWLSKMCVSARCDSKGAQSAVISLEPSCLD